MERKYCFFITIILILLYSVGCAPTLQLHPADSTYKGFIPTIEVANKSVLLRCYCGNFYNLDASEVFTESGGNKLKSLVGYWKHVWGYDFKTNFIDSVYKVGLKPIEVIVPMQNPHDINSLVSEAEKRNCKYLFVVRSDIINQKLKQHWIKNFTRGCIYGGLFLWASAIADINSVLIEVENDYIVYDVEKKSIVLDKKYQDKDEQEFKCYQIKGDFPVGYLTTRQDIFMSLQNKLTSLFWNDFIEINK